MPQQSINAFDRRRYSSSNDGLASAVTRSTEQTILVSDLLSEGPIEGLVGGGAGIFLNNDALQNAEQTAMQPASGILGAFVANSTTVNVNPGVGTFNASVGSEGKRYLMVYGVYSTSVTMSDISLPTSGFTFTGSPFDSTFGQVKRIPIGGNVVLTKTAGSDMAATWAHPAANNGAAIVTAPATDTLFTNLKLSQSGHDLRGGLSNVNVTNQTATFTWGGQRSWKLLMSDADRANGVVHTLEAGVFLEIASISGNTITLVQAPGFAGNYRFGITKTILDDDATGSERAILEEKYKNAGWSFNSGTVDQAPLPTIEGVGTTSVALSVSDSALDKNAARIVTASGAQASEIDEVKILINYPSGLYYVSERSGREYPGGVAYKIELGIDNGAGFVYKILEGPGGKKYNEVPVWVHSGLHKSGISFEMRFSLEEKQPFNGFKVRITRMTQHNPNDGGAVSPGLTTQKTRYKSVYTSVISSVIGIIKEKLSYPHTAMANVTFSSKSFDNVPTRSYDCQGLKVKVPSNYVTREQNPSNTDRGKVALYTRNAAGVITDPPVAQLWDGDFSDDLVYTDNPAWVFYDVLTNNRYGLGDYLKSTDIDKYSLYKISKYCDELVPDGKGGTEPRFRANIYLTKATDSYKVLKDMATIFRGILYWTDSTFRPVIDQKTEPVYTFSRSNVIDGTFNYETTGSKTRVNQMVVDWINPEAEYKLEPIIVEDRENQIKTGVIKSEKAVAFGCTSEGQAIRYGRWKLWTALNQTEIINFSTSVNAAFLSPGDVVNIQDEADFNIAFSGRVNSCTSSAITIDRAISSDFAGGHTYTIAVILPKRTVLLNQDSAVIDDNGGGTSTYNRGDDITHADVQGTTTQLLHATNEDLTRRQVESAVDTSGNLLNLQYINETVVEERTLTTGSTTTADGRDTIPISSAFSVLPTNGDVWAIKQVSTAGETTAASYKEYKILGIAEGAKEVYSIVAAEYSAQKFDSVDSEFLLATADPLYPPENTEEVPPPRNLRVLTTSNPDQPGEEVMVEWDSPLAAGSSGVSTTYEHLAEFNVSQTFSNVRIPASSFGGGFVQLLGDRVTVPSETRSLKYSGVPDGVHTVTVQTVSGKGRTSKKVSAVVNIEDIFEGNFPRLGGLIKGGFSTSDVAVIDSGSQKGSVKFGKTSLVTAPLPDINLAKRNTSADANSYGLSCTALAHSSWPYQEDGVDLGYLMMDFSAFDASNGSANALKLIARKLDTTTYGRSISYWYDGIKFVADADSIWTSLGTCTMTKDSRKIVGSGFSSLELGRVITVGSSYAAKIALIESNTVMYVDFPWTVATATSQALKGQELIIDYENDFIIAPVSYNASGTDSAGYSGKYALGGEKNTMSFLQITPELAGIGKSVVVTSTLNFLSYDADEAQLTSIPNTGIVLSASAIGWTNPEFQFTGGGFSQVNQAAESGFTAGQDGTRDFTVHNNASAVTYTALPADFTVTAREALDPDNSVTTKSSIFSIGKLKEGSQGNSAAVVYLYKMSENVPASIDDTSSFPTVTVSMTTGKIIAASGYSISSNQIMDSSGSGTGWYTVVTDTSVTDGVQWVSASSASGTGASDTIARTEWTDPIQFSGSPGASGVSSALVELYQRTDSTSAPPDPSANLTYTFASGVLTNSLGQPAVASGTTPADFNSWVTAATSPIDTAKYLWKITAPAISTETTDVIEPANWATAILAAQFGAEGEEGEEGERGKQNFVGTLFYGTGIPDTNNNGSPNSPPSLPSGGAFTFSDKTFTTSTIADGSESIVDKWSFTSPTFTSRDGSNQKLFYYACSVTAIEEDSLNGTSTGGNLVFNNLHIIHSFSGVVAFTDLSANTSTVIHGNNITTGIIQSASSNYGTDAEGHFATSGTHLDLDDGRLRSPKFYIDGSGLGFKDGAMGGTNSLGGTITVGNKVIIDGTNEKIEITDGTNVRVKIGKLS
jgi:predicted phage tail protein